VVLSLQTLPLRADILGAVEQKLGMAMQNDKISTLCMETERSMNLGTIVGKESHFKIYAYAPVKPGNYETPPTEQRDWPSHCLKHSQNYIKMLQPHSWSTSFARNCFIALECSLEDVQIKCDDIVLDLWAETYGMGQGGR